MVDVHKELMKLRAEIPASDSLPKADTLRAHSLGTAKPQKAEYEPAAKAVILIRDANARLMKDKLDAKAIEELKVAKGILETLPEGGFLPYSGTLYDPNGNKYIFGKDDIGGWTGNRRWTLGKRELKEGMIERENAKVTYHGLCRDWISFYEQSMAAKAAASAPVDSSREDSLAKINQKLVQEQKVTEPDAISDGLKLMHLVNIAEGEIRRGEYQKAVETIRLADAHLAAGKEVGWGHFAPPEGVEAGSLPAAAQTGWVELRKAEDYSDYLARLRNFAQEAQNQPAPAAQEPQQKGNAKPAAAWKDDELEKAGITQAALAALRGERGVLVDSEEKRTLLEQEAAWRAVRYLKSTGLISADYSVETASSEERAIVNQAFAIFFIKGYPAGKRLLEASFALQNAQDAAGALNAIKSIPEELAGKSPASRKWFSRILGEVGLE